MSIVTKLRQRFFGLTIEEQLNKARKVHDGLHQQVDAINKDIVRLAEDRQALVKQPDDVVAAVQSRLDAAIETLKAKLVEKRARAADAKIAVMILEVSYLEKKYEIPD